MGDNNMAVCLFGMHLFENCWTDLSEILHNYGGLSQTLCLTFCWWSPQGPTRGAENWFSYVYSNWQCFLWQPLFQKQFSRELSEMDNPASVLNGLSENSTLMVICCRTSPEELSLNSEGDTVSVLYWLTCLCVLWLQSSCVTLWCPR